MHMSWWLKYDQWLKTEADYNCVVTNEHWSFLKRMKAWKNYIGMRIYCIFSMIDLNVMYEHPCGSRIYIVCEHGFGILDQKNDATIG